MTAIITDNGDGTHTVSFTYTAETARINNTLTEACEFLYKIDDRVWIYVDDEKVAFEDLTAQQRADSLDKWIRSSLIRNSKRNHVDSAVEDANITAVEEAASMFIPE